jgi:hypothetical protein
MEIEKLEKQEFTVVHNDKEYQCYIDEDGYVWYLNERGVPHTGMREGKPKNMEEAKEIAVKSILEHGY